MREREGKEKEKKERKRREMKDEKIRKGFFSLILILERRNEKRK